MTWSFILNYYWIRKKENFCQVKTSVLFVLLFIRLFLLYESFKIISVYSKKSTNQNLWILNKLKLFWLTKKKKKQIVMDDFIGHSFEEESYGGGCVQNQDLKVPPVISHHSTYYYYNNRTLARSSDCIELTSCTWKMTSRKYDKRIVCKFMPDWSGQLKVWTSLFVPIKCTELFFFLHWCKIVKVFRKEKACIKKYI